MTKQATLWYVALLVLSLPLFAACGGEGEGGGEEGAPAASAEALEAGEEVFTGKGLCYTCHGSDGTGTQLGPDLTDGEWLNLDPPPTQDKIETVVREGVQEPVEHAAPMPPMGGAQLTDEEVTNVSAYVYQMSQ